MNGPAPEPAARRAPLDPYTGAGRPADGMLDHFAWVTMTADGPKVLNVIVDDLPHQVGLTPATE